MPYRTIDREYRKYQQFWIDSMPEAGRRERQVVNQGIETQQRREKKHAVHTPFPGRQQSTDGQYRRYREEQVGHLLQPFSRKTSPKEWEPAEAYPALFMKVREWFFGRRVRAENGGRSVMLAARAVLGGSDGRWSVGKVRDGGFRVELCLSRACMRQGCLGWQGRASRAKHPAPAPLAGRRTGKEMKRADARPCGAPKPVPERPVAAAVRAVSRPERVHSWCARPAGATPASARKRRRSAAPGTGWPRNRCNWCGRSAGRAVP